MKKVLITREEKQARKTAQLLEKEGFKPILFPTIRFEKVSFDKKDLVKADIVIFSSQNAVEFLLSEIDINHLKGKTIIATGEKTEKALKKKGIKNVIIPEIYSAEGVANLIKSKKEFKGKKAVAVRPVEGLNTLIDELESYLEIKPLPVYKTVPNTPENKDQIKKELEKGQIYAVIFTSPSTFENFIRIFPDSWKDLLKKTKTAVIGTTTAQALLKMGINPDVIPQKFTLDHLIKNLKQLNYPDC
ncbi:uroporphyrinogen-III synthase [Persephonella sp.]|uniref:uroporphyrinogen-III synthase n=1 Tax=Persephonella sp. TaxID=2060922 RepID=UPI0025D13E6F|nr:uroporphyrinogen-III synthase [Persephonella sp.]